MVYAAACQALAAARTTDEVRRIHGSAAMLRAYAKQAKNKQLELDAAEIRIRAERRVGELMAAQRDTVGLNVGSRLVGPNTTRQDDKATLADVGIDKHLADRARKLATVPDEEFERLVTMWRDRTEQNDDRVTLELLRSSKLDVHYSSETPEHYTPEPFLAHVRAVFGDIPDLDPCSNSREAPNVAAHHHYTVAENGLAQPWYGRVFLNPPYGREISAWVNKLRNEWSRGAVHELITLLPARPDTEWFNELTTDTDDAVICFLYGRLIFVGNVDAAPFPSMAMYFGPHHHRFADVFASLGSLWQRPAAPLEWFVDHDYP